MILPAVIPGRAEAGDPVVTPVSPVVPGVVIRVVIRGVIRGVTVMVGPGRGDVVAA